MKSPKVNTGLLLALKHAMVLMSVKMQPIRCDCLTDESSTNWLHYRSEFGRGSCYTTSIDKMDFNAAKDFCENQLNMHVVFFETAGEHAEISTRCPTRKVWLGLSRFAGNWYWTYYNAMMGLQTTFIFWGTPPDTGTQLVADFNSVWRAVNPSEQHYVMCEEDDDWAAMLAGFQPLYTPTSETMTSIVSVIDSCETARSTRAHQSLYRMSTLVRLRRGFLESEFISRSRTLLTCAKYCFLDDTCCEVGYSRANGTCYRLTRSGRTSGSTIILDCSKTYCYRVGY